VVGRSTKRGRGQGYAEQSSGFWPLALLVLTNCGADTVGRPSHDADVIFRDTGPRPSSDASNDINDDPPFADAGEPEAFFCSIPECSTLCLLLPDGRCQAANDSVRCWPLEGLLVDISRNCRFNRNAASTYRCLGFPADPNRVFGLPAVEACHEYLGVDGAIEIVTTGYSGWPGYLPDGDRFRECSAQQYSDYVGHTLPFCPP